MSRTTTREIIKVCADLARMDRKGKMEVLRYLQDEIQQEPNPPKEPVTDKEGGEQ